MVKEEELSHEGEYLAGGRAPAAPYAAQTRILAWNLLHGGGSRIEAIAAAVAGYAPELVCLAEYRTARRAQLEAAFAGHGFEIAASSEPPPRTNGVVLLARGPLGAVLPAPPGLPPARWVGRELPCARLALACVHVPPKISIGLEAKQRVWDGLLHFADDYQTRPALLLGDLNTGAPYRDEPRASLACADAFVTLSQMWVDAWRRFHGPDAREWTWLSPGRGRRIGYGYRLDHAFCSPPLAGRLTACRYSHAERDAGLSDHSLLLLDLC